MITNKKIEGFTHTPERALGKQKRKAFDARLVCGFTLMEVLIYAGILSVTGTILSGVLLNTTRIKSRQTAVIEVNEQLTFVLQNIQRSIIDSSIIDIDSGTSTSTLILKFKDDTKNPTKFYIADNKVYKKVAANTAQPLTDSNVIADAVNFLKVSGYSGHDSIQIDLTLSYNTGNPASTFSRTLSSAVARVSAATFDSNLIPGTTSFYDIGTTALPWNNVYINGSVGIGNTAPLSKLGVTGSASVGATYGVIAAPTSGMIIEGKTGIASSTPWGLLSVNPNGITGPAFVIGSSTATKFIVNNGGNVGIGTANPITSLEVNGDSSGTQILVRGYNTAGLGKAMVNLQSARGSALSPTDLQTGDALGEVPFAGYAGGGFRTTAAIRAVVGTGTISATSLPGDILFMTAANGTVTRLEKMRLTSEGNVGIASTTPWGLLSVNPSGITGPAFVIGSSTATNLIVTNNGLVGIGTTTPTSILHIYKATSPGIAIDGPAGQYRDVIFRTDGTLRWLIRTSNTAESGSNAGSDLQIWSRTDAGGALLSPAFMIQRSSGNVGIGTTEPSVKLEVSNATGYTTQLIDSKDTSYAYVRTANSTTGTTFGNEGATGAQVAAGGIPYAGIINQTGAYPLQFATNNTVRMIILSGGNVGIGTTDPGTHALSVVGTAGLSTGTAWTSTSDQRWKDVYSELKGESLNKIMALRPISYKWNALHNSQFGENPGLKYGFIAQEVKKVIPEMISQDAKGYYWYNPTGMEAILTGAIQEQQKQIEDLKAEVAELKLKIK